MQMSWLTFKKLLMKLWLISKNKKPQATSFLTLLIFLLQFQLKPIKELHELIQKISNLYSVSCVKIKFFLEA